jgi:hypothetical protein
MSFLRAPFATKDLYGDGVMRILVGTSKSLLWLYKIKVLAAHRLRTFPVCLPEERSVRRRISMAMLK